MKIRKANSEDIAAIKKLADLLYLDIPGFDWNKEEFYWKSEPGEYGGHKFHRLEFKLND